MDARSADGRAVVIPAVDVPSSVACLRSLGRRGIPTILLLPNQRVPAARSKYCRTIVSVPEPEVDLDGYAESVRDVAGRPDVLTVVPHREEDVYVLSRHRPELADEVRALWPPFETLRTVQDRIELFAAADDAGVSAPETRRLDEWDDWSRRSIIKPRYTVSAPAYLAGGVGADVDLDRRDADPSTRYVPRGTRPDRDEVVARYGHVPIVQEFVPGPHEYGFFALYDHGRPVATFQHRQLRGYRYSGGPSAYRESVAIPALEDAGRSLLDHLEWHGLAMVEFLRDEESGDFELMEVNPRFWSSLPFTVQAGVDFPHLFWQLARGRDDVTDPDYETGLAGHLVRGELLYLRSVVSCDPPLVERPPLGRALTEVLSSLVRHPRFDYLSRDDPRPFVRDAINTLLTTVAGKRPRSAPSRTGAVTSTSRRRR